MPPSFHRAAGKSQQVGKRPGGLGVEARSSFQKDTTLNGGRGSRQRQLPDQAPGPTSYSLSADRRLGPGL